MTRFRRGGEVVGSDWRSASRADERVERALPVGLARILVGSRFVAKVLIQQFKAIERLELVLAPKPSSRR